MEYIDGKMNKIVRLLKKTGLISFDFIYRFYFMAISGSKLYYRHKIESYRSCAFCRHLAYDRQIKKYVCSYGEYEACGALLPCIVPDPSFVSDQSYQEEEEQVPWLFKTPCLNFDVLDSKNYFRNFISFDLNSSVIRLEALEGILLGSCSGNIPCHICACVNKETYTQCKYLQKAGELGKCTAIYDTLNKCFAVSSKLSNVS